MIKPPRTADEPTRRHMVVVADVSELAALRRQVVQRLKLEAAPQHVVDDLEVVVSELATNVIQHTLSTTITVSVHRTADAWFVDVYDAEGVPDLLGPDRILPSVDAPTGRGLVIAAALTDSMVPVLDGDRVMLRCERHA